MIEGNPGRFEHHRDQEFHSVDIVVPQIRALLSEQSPERLQWLRKPALQVGLAAHGVKDGWFIETIESDLEQIERLLLHAQLPYYPIAPFPNDRLKRAMFVVHRDQARLATFQEIGVHYPALTEHDHRTTGRFLGYSDTQIQTWLQAHPHILERHPFYQALRAEAQISDSIILASHMIGFIPSGPVDPHAEAMGRRIQACLARINPKLPQELIALAWQTRRMGLPKPSPLGWTNWKSIT